MNCWKKLKPWPPMHMIWTKFKRLFAKPGRNGAMVFPSGTGLVFNYGFGGISTCPYTGCVVAYDEDAGNYLVSSDYDGSVVKASIQEVWRYAAEYKKFMGSN